MTKQIQKNKFDEITDRIIDKLGNIEKKKAEIIIDGAIEFDKAGFDKSKISNELVKRLARVVDESYVRKVLKDYPQYKEEYRVENAKKRNSSRNIPAKPARTKNDERKPIELPADKVKVEGTTSEQEKYEAEVAASMLGATSVRVIHGSPEEQPEQCSPTVEPQMEQLGPKEVQGVPNIAPEDYNLGDIHLYDKDTLVKVVQWLDERDEENTHNIIKLQEENAALMKELEPFKYLLDNSPSHIKTKFLAQIKKSSNRLRKLIDAQQREESNKALSPQRDEISQENKEAMNSMVAKLLNNAEHLM